MANQHIIEVLCIYCGVGNNGRRPRETKRQIHLQEDTGTRGHAALYSTTAPSTPNRNNKTLSQNISLNTNHYWGISAAGAAAPPPQRPPLLPGCAPFFFSAWDMRHNEPERNRTPLRHRFPPRDRGGLVFPSLSGRHVGMYDRGNADRNAAGGPDRPETPPQTP